MKYKLYSFVTLNAKFLQVNERTKDVLKQWYEFQERGQIFVKGKDNMTVFLFTKPKENAIRMF